MNNETQFARFSEVSRVDVLMQNSRVAVCSMSHEAASEVWGQSELNLNINTNES